MLGFNWKPFTQAEEHQIKKAIEEAENRTSGEIRVHVDSYCKTNPVFKAQNKFLHLKMDQTDAKNGVLIYVAIKEKKFAIVGDVGIDAKVPPGFWESTKDVMQAKFSAGEIVNGICKGIEEAGHQLKQFFPVQDDDINELNDDISYG